MSNTPIDDELDALRQADNGVLNFVTLHQFRTIARAVLEKWGTPQPVVREPLSDDVVRDAARWRMAVLIGSELMLRPDKRTHATAVTLQDCPDEVPERARAQAEARYAKALEQALGGPEEVAAALDTMSGLEGSADEDISQADLELAARWAKACTAARQAGFRDLGEAECMYFDVRLS